MVQKQTLDVGSRAKFGAKIAKGSLGMGSRRGRDHSCLSRWTGIGQVQTPYLTQ